MNTIRGKDINFEKIQGKAFYILEASLPCPWTGGTMEIKLPSQNFHVHSIRVLDGKNYCRFESFTLTGFVRSYNNRVRNNNKYGQAEKLQKSYIKYLRKGV